uniref:Uncharacterized protein n=1 Tax=Oryza rufipogon TaxID=4529 RepID=A0A0E0PR31_ORYRU
MGPVTDNKQQHAASRFDWTLKPDVGSYWGATIWALNQCQSGNLALEFRPVQRKRRSRINSTFAMAQEQHLFTRTPVQLFNKIPVMLSRNDIYKPQGMINTEKKPDGKTRYSPLIQPMCFSAAAAPLFDQNP